MSLIISKWIEVAQGVLQEAFSSQHAAPIYCIDEYLEDPDIVLYLGLSFYQTQELSLSDVNFSELEEQLDELHDIIESKYPSFDEFLYAYIW